VRKDGAVAKESAKEQTRKSKVNAMANFTERRIDQHESADPIKNGQRCRQE
jgi:hypothetical protein